METIKEYRTQEQFEEIADSVINGNYTQAGIECVSYGFYAKDLLDANEELEILTMENIVYLVEVAMKARFDRKGE